MTRLNEDVADLMLSPLVVHARMPVLMAETLRSPFDRPETTRMVMEKMAALQEGWMAGGIAAMGLATSRSSMTVPSFFWPSLFWPPGWSAVGDATRSVGSAIMRPLAKRVRSNAKRLKKR